MTRWRRFALGSCVLAAAAAAIVWFLNVRDETAATAPTANATDANLIARGAYLASAGNCMACHTARGGERYAGGLGIATPFGTVFTSNLTPDAGTGLGNWSAADFWRALHNGRSKSGRLLYPAFPYTSYTRVTREDSDAMFAYLRSLPAVKQANQPHALRFPYQSQAALAVWRALYFSPGAYQPDASRNAEWNRGAYLVTGLGHCSACHSPRDALGGTRAGKALDLAGGLIPMQNWYAPSLASPQEAGVADWDREDIVSLLKNGVSPQASVTGPMAEVVLRSTQYLNREDLGAMAHYLKALPASHPSSEAPARVARADFNLAQAAKLYDQHCAQCHSDKGQGVANAYPPLAGNRAVTMPSIENLVQIVLNGAYAPATDGNPRPFGMPPFVLVLGDSEVAAVISFIRTSWGNQASDISPLQVQRIRANQAR